MQKKIMTSIKLQKNLHFQLQQRIIADRYGMRGKSKWIIESIEAFLTIPDFPTYVDIADDMEQHSDMISIRLTDDLMNRIEQSIAYIRQQYPMIEGVKSKLIRASIMQRIIRSETSVTEVVVK